LIPILYPRKQKQVELHVLPCLWILLNSVKGNTNATNSGASFLNSAVQKLAINMYEQMGEQLIEKATNNSNVTNRNLELLKEMLNSC
jgi:hypothetical protein